MLAVFQRSVGKPPEELTLPSTEEGAVARGGEEIANLFRASFPEATFYHFSRGNFLAASHIHEGLDHARSVVAMEDIFCVFIGNVENMGDLRRHYGLNRHATEPFLIVELYKVLRDRGTYTADQLVKDLNGKFAFVLYDAPKKTLFTARDRDGTVMIQWGVAWDGSLVFSDEAGFIKDVCGASACAFPAGCLFLNRGRGLMSFVHPLFKVKGYPREDDTGKVTSVFFQVDVYTRVPSIPRVGSAETWGDSTDSASEEKGREAMEI